MYNFIIFKLKICFKNSHLFLSLFLFSLVFNFGFDVSNIEILSVYLLFFKSCRGRYIRIVPYTFASFCHLSRSLCFYMHIPLLSSSCFFSFFLYFFSSFYFNKHKGKETHESGVSKKKKKKKIIRATVDSKSETLPQKRGKESIGLI